MPKIYLGPQICPRCDGKGRVNDLVDVPIPRKETENLILQRAAWLRRRYKPPLASMKIAQALTAEFDISLDRAEQMVHKAIKAIRGADKWESGPRES